MKRILLIASSLTLMAASAWGQGCALCSKTAADLGDKGARGLNGGIVYLALLPLACMGTIGFVWWRNNRNA